MFFKFQSIVWASMVSLLATTTVVAIESNIQVSFCGSKDDILSISELSFEPEYVQPGDVVMIYGSGALSRDISPGSKIEATFKCNGTEYYNTTYDYCSFVEKKEIDGDLKCPVSQGSLEVAQKIRIPNNTAKGLYTFHLAGTTDDGQPIGCADLQVTF